MRPRNALLKRLSDLGAIIAKVNWIASVSLITSMSLIAGAVFITACSGSGTPAPLSSFNATSCPEAVPPLPFQVTQVVDREAPGFTEGLLFNAGHLFESTGAYDSPSDINEIDPRTGAVRQVAATPNNDFGEGLALFQDHYYQLAYTSRNVYEYDLKWNLIATLTSPLAEGWGLAPADRKTTGASSSPGATVPGTAFIVSDGSDTLYSIRVDFTQILSTIKVHDGTGRKYTQLNELEAVGPVIYANIWLSNKIIAVDLNSGCVIGSMDLTSLLDSFSPAQLNAIHSDVNYGPNGIAYSNIDQALYVTGKNWPKIFKIAVQTP